MNGIKSDCSHLANRTYISKGFFFVQTPLSWQLMLSYNADSPCNCEVPTVYGNTASHESLYCPSFQYPVEAASNTTWRTIIFFNLVFQITFISLQIRFGFFIFWFFILFFFFLQWFFIIIQKSLTNWFEKFLHWGQHLIGSHWTIVHLVNCHL